MKKETLDIGNAIEDIEEKVQSAKNPRGKNVGRKPKDPRDVANKRVVLYFSENQLEKVDEYCHQTRQKLGTFIKDTFLNAFEGKKDEVGEIQKFIDSLDEEEIGRLVKAYLSQGK